MRRRLLLGTLLTLVVVLASGCIGPGRGMGPFPNTPKANQVSGKIVYGDTGLVVSATIQIGGETVVTEDGKFVVELKPGTHQYSVVHLLGSDVGAVTVTEGKEITITVPVFNDFSEAEYNALLVWGDKTMRWDRGKRIDVWIEGAAGIDEGHKDRVWRAFDAWQSALNDAVEFVSAVSKAEADIVVTWDSASGLDAGSCQYLDFDDRTGLIREASMVVAAASKDKDSAYYHAVGHCVGLKHSIDESFVMHSEAKSAAIERLERDYARLLYALPVGSPAI